MRGVVSDTRRDEPARGTAPDPRRYPPSNTWAQRLNPVDISIRIAAESDVGVFASLRRAWNEERAGGPIDDAGFGAVFYEWWAVERPNRTFFLVEVDGTAVGMANVKRYDRMPAAGHSSGGCWGYVGNIFVLAEHRDTGVGRALLEEVIAWASEAGMAHLRLAPSPLSKSFYARLGFRPGAVVELDPRRG